MGRNHPVGIILAAHTMLFGAFVNQAGLSWGRLKIPNDHT